MEGYVQNDGVSPKFVAQRAFPQAGRATFEQLHLTFARKSSCKSLNKEFIQWLRDNTFSDDFWSFHKADGTDYKFAPPKSPPKVTSEIIPATSEAIAEAPQPVLPTEKKKPAKGAGRRMIRDKSGVPKGVGITPGSIIESPFTSAKPMIDKCKDRSVLKKALTLTRHFSNKEEHMRHIVRRLEQV